MVTSSQQVSSQSSDKKIPKPTKAVLQRVVARGIGRILLDADEAMDAVDEYLSPSSLNASYENLLGKKKYSRAKLIELLARALGENDYLRQMKLVQEQALGKIRGEHRLLFQSSSDRQPGGKSPSTYLWAAALQIARDHQAETGKYLSAGRVLIAVCREAFHNDVVTYVAEVQKKQKGPIPYEDSVNALWMPFKGKYGMPISKRTVSDWLKEANLIGASKKLGRIK